MVLDEEGFTSGEVLIKEDGVVALGGRTWFCHAWVFLAKIKELHEHRFGSHFVNNFPCFRNQIDPIMKQSVHDSQSPKQEQIISYFRNMNTNFVCNVCGKQFMAKNALYDYNWGVHTKVESPCNTDLQEQNEIGKPR